MKKILCLLMVLLLGVTAFAETARLLPVRLLPQEQAAIPLAGALNQACQAVDNLPAQVVIRGELAELSDSTAVWVVTIFDTATFADAWCIMVDAATGKVCNVEKADAGFFTGAYTAWTERWGMHELWSMEQKMLYDTLYALQPSYGQPLPTDLPQTAALQRALQALGLASADGYETGFGYLMGGDGFAGVWEISLVQSGRVCYRVNLDAVSGEVYYMETDEAGNG